MQCKPQPYKRAETAIVVSDRIDFKAKYIARHKNGSFNDKRVSFLRRYNNCKHICIQQQSSRIHAEKTDGIKGRNRKFNNNS